MDGLSRDEQDLARFGYKQELKRSLGVFSSFAVAFSYISPSTGIFALFFLGLTTVGGVFIWSWPIVAIGQLLVALGFAELSSHYPVAGSVFQWTKYLAGQDVLVVHRLDLPLRRDPDGRVRLRDAAVRAHPGLQQHGLEPREQPLEPALDRRRSRSSAITVMNIFGVRLVAIVNNTGVLFEILGHGRVRVHRRALPSPSERGRDLPHRRDEPHDRHVPRGDVHVALRDLRLRHGVDARRGDEEPATRGAAAP